MQEKTLAHHVPSTFLLGTTGLLAFSACSSDPEAATATPRLGISAIPDQDPELLNRL